MSSKNAHLSRQIRDVQRISQGEDGIVEGGKHLRSLARPDLAAILTQGDIATPMQPIFNLPMRPIEL